MAFLYCKDNGVVYMCVCIRIMDRVVLFRVAGSPSKWQFDLPVFFDVFCMHVLVYVTLCVFRGKSSLAWASWSGFHKQMHISCMLMWYLWNFGGMCLIITAKCHENGFDSSWCPPHGQHMLPYWVGCTHPLPSVWNLKLERCFTSILPPGRARFCQ